MNRKNKTLRQIDEEIDAAERHLQALRDQAADARRAVLMAALEETHPALVETHRGALERLLASIAFRNQAAWSQVTYSRYALFQALGMSREEDEARIDDIISAFCQANPPLLVAEYAYEDGEEWCALDAADVAGIRERSLNPVTGEVEAGVAERIVVHHRLGSAILGDAVVE